MSIFEAPINTLSGEATTLAEHKGKALLLVNVASKCGLTPQYAGLQELHETYHDRGFAVLGFPCNQFMGQEPGTPSEIAAFCESNYGVSFPLYEKIDVNGDAKHPIFQELEETADSDGHSGEIRWNFEKFLVAASGEIVGRYAPTIEPLDGALVGDIEDALPS